LEQELVFRAGEDDGQVPEQLPCASVSFLDHGPVTLEASRTVAGGADEEPGREDVPGAGRVVRLSCEGFGDGGTAAEIGQERELLGGRGGLAGGVRERGDLGRRHHEQVTDG
jgi:hypothetical protein